MRKNYNFSVIAAGTVVLVFLLTGCGVFGKVEQGRVVAWDPSGGLVTLILDSNTRGDGGPKYDVLPPISVRIPQDPSQMGPSPVPGGLVDLDLAAGTAVVYEAEGRTLKIVQFTLIEKLDGVPPEDGRVKGGSLPAVDRDKQTVTLYSPKTRQIVTISPGADALSLDNWRAGDEVRYYFKDPAQALRMMNVTRTRLS